MEDMAQAEDEKALRKQEQQTAHVMWLQERIALSISSFAPRMSEAFVDATYYAFRLKRTSLDESYGFQLSSTQTGLNIIVGLHAGGLAIKLTRLAFGDMLVSVNETSVLQMKRKDVVEKIKSTLVLNLTVARGEKIFGIMMEDAARVRMRMRSLIVRWQWRRKFRVLVEAKIKASEKAAQDLLKRGREDVAAAATAEQERQRLTRFEAERKVKGGFESGRDHGLDIAVKTLIQRIVARTEAEEKATQNLLQNAHDHVAALAKAEQDCQRLTRFEAERSANEEVEARRDHGQDIRETTVFQHVEDVHVQLDEGVDQRAKEAKAKTGAEKKATLGPIRKARKGIITFAKGEQERQRLTRLEAERNTKQEPALRLDDGVDVAKHVDDVHVHLDKKDDHQAKEDQTKIDTGKKIRQTLLQKALAYAAAVAKAEQERQRVAAFEAEAERKAKEEVESRPDIGQDNGETTIMQRVTDVHVQLDKEVDHFTTDAQAKTGVEKKAKLNPLRKVPKDAAAAAKAEQEVQRLTRFEAVRKTKEELESRRDHGLDIIEKTVMQRIADERVQLDKNVDHQAKEDQANIEAEERVTQDIVQKVHDDGDVAVVGKAEQKHQCLAKFEAEASKGREETESRRDRVVDEDVVQSDKFGFRANEAQAKPEAQETATQDLLQKAREDIAAAAKAEQECKRHAKLEAEKKAVQDLVRKSHEDAEVTAEAEQELKRVQRLDAEREAREAVESRLPNWTMPVFLPNSGEKLAMAELRPVQTVSELQLAIATDATLPILPRVFIRGKDAEGPLPPDAMIRDVGLCSGTELVIEIVPAIVTASQDGTAKIWNAETAVCERTLHGHTDIVCAACWSPNGRFVVTASEDCIAKAFNSRSGNLERDFIGHTDAIYCAAVGSDSKNVATGSADSTARLWNVKMGDCLQTLKGHTAPIYSISFSPDDEVVVTIARDCTSRLWNRRTGVCQRSLRLGGSEPQYCVSYSLDGSSFVTCTGDKIAKVMSTATGQQRHVLDGHTGLVLSAFYSPDVDADAARHARHRTTQMPAMTDVRPRGRAVHAGRVVHVDRRPRGRAIQDGRTESCRLMRRSRSSSCALDFQSCR